MNWYTSRAVIGADHPQNLTSASTYSPSSAFVGVSYMPSEADIRSTILPDVSMAALWSVMNPEGSGKVMRVLTLELVPQYVGLALLSASGPLLGSSSAALMRVNGVSGGSDVSISGHDSANSAPNVSAVTGASFSSLGTIISSGSSPTVGAVVNAMGSYPVAQPSFPTNSLPVFRNAVSLRNANGSMHQTLAVLREGESIGIVATGWAGPHIYDAVICFSIGSASYSATVRVGGGVNAPLIITNNAGSGVVVNINQWGILQGNQYSCPKFALSLIESHTGGSTVPDVKPDTASPDSVADIRTGAYHSPLGTRYGALASKDIFRVADAINGPTPGGTGVAPGIAVQPRPLDILGKQAFPAITLRPGQGIALHQRMLSAYGTYDLLAQYTVDDLPAGGGISRGRQLMG